MRATTILLLGAVIAAAGCSSGTSSPPDDPEVAIGAVSQQQELSYGIGLYLGRETRQGVDADGVVVDAQLVIQGFVDGLRENDPMFDEEDLADLMNAVHEEMQKRTAQRLLAENAEFKAIHDENQEKSLRFAADYGQMPNVVSLNNGLKYRELKPGQGAKPGPEATIVANYSVKRIDGTEVLARDEAVFEVDDVVEGGGVILQMMSVGGQWEVMMPPQLAYGAVGKPPHIEPNETVIVTVELVEIR